MTFFLSMDNKLYTCNSVPGSSVYGEELVDVDGTEYRSFTPARSKLAAFLKKGLPPDSIPARGSFLYLGAANGTTVSHLADLAPYAIIHAVEMSSRCFRDLMELAATRKNVVPILADASRPESYRYQVSRADLLYQDVSQRDQVAIFLANARCYLKDDGCALFMVKANCIDSARPSTEIYSIVRGQLVTAGFRILESQDIAPYQKDHMAFYLRWERRQPEKGR